MEFTGKEKKAWSGFEHTNIGNIFLTQFHPPEVEVTSPAFTTSLETKPAWLAMEGKQFGYWF